MKTLPQEENFLALEEKYSNFENSKYVILPAPYEHTVSYGGGTKDGPDAIIQASQYVEFYDDELEREICFESGFATLPELDFSDHKDEKAIDLIYTNVKNLLDKDKFVITLGGEHTISTAPIKAHFEKYPNMSLLQFDAHSDLRDTYEDSKWSHACIMARVAEFMNPSNFHQVGIRAQCKEEAQFIKDNNVNTYYASAIRTGKHGSNWQKTIVDKLSNEIYLTFDVDYFDPSIMPSTGTPEPDGFLYSETIDVFREIKKQGKRIVGIDLVELSPIKNLHHADILSARLLYKILNVNN